ncbi:electron transfer flavoprotein beta subunit [Fusarium sporotrichioides]|uniref:Probable electron transfer flavoprotein subunit beta n=1 Tax=Fusarium sporotrichioides TaxID=5514 RepID=A0A395RRG9_FUSSP|nr:electron transfer flavoprotein beta subunit [Fusarium sporotrichioides]
MTQSLRILVPLKRVVDYSVKVRIRKDSKGVEKNGVKHSLNPFDELSVEEAIRLRGRKHPVDEIVAVSAGPLKCQDVLRTAMAMGADRAIHINVSEEQAEFMEPLVVAKLLQAVVKKEKSNLVLMGKQAIDNDFGQTGQLLAGLLNWPQATQASKIEFEGENATVTREIDGGTETVEGSLPMLVTTDLRLNEPRYAALPSIMKAKKKKIEQRTLQDYGVEDRKMLQVLQIDGG